MSAQGNHGIQMESAGQADRDRRGCLLNGDGGTECKRALKLLDELNDRASI